MLCVAAGFEMVVMDFSEEIKVISL